MRKKMLVIGIVTLEVLSACGLAALVASFASAPQTPLVIVQPIQIIAAQLSGYYINLHSLPVYVSWLKYFSFVYYAYNLILLTQWHNVPCSLFSTNVSITTLFTKQQVCLQTGNDVLSYYGVRKNDFNFDIWMLIILTVALHLAAFIVIVIRIRHAI